MAVGEYSPGCGELFFHVFLFGQWKEENNLGWILWLERNTASLKDILCLPLGSSISRIISWPKAGLRLT